MHKLNKEKEITPKAILRKTENIFEKSDMPCPR